MITVELTSTVAAPISWAVRDFYIYIDKVEQSKVDPSIPVYAIATEASIDQAALANDWIFQG
jgi:hypothetical protein